MGVWALGEDFQPAEPLAIVGVGCRFAGGADGPEGLWSVLRQGRDVVGEVPEGRWDVDRLHHPDPARPGRIYTRAGAFLDGIDAFDARFFGIAPREASRMDPQQRLLLQVAWEALEDAGVVPAKLAGTAAGVFVGVSYSDYARLQFAAPASINAYTDLGSALSLVANRVSHALDLRGPSMALDTACSSSLVAVHLACRSLRSGESDLALAGGVNLILDPGFFIGLAKASMLSPTGRCRSFGEGADGFVRAEGVGVVVLKTLSRALADGDRVLAVVLATGVNSDGRTPGVALPRSEAQAELLRAVYAQAGIDPGTVYYVEAHGTGTRAGDPVECQALGEVLGRGREGGEPLRIGSIKSNIGHAEPAAGIAGLVKAALALEHGELPASLHGSPPNPDIPFAALGLRVQTAAEPLPRDGSPLVMGVNSFGFGGTNAHVVVREWRPAEAEAGGRPAGRRRGAADDRRAAAGHEELLLLSARGEDRLRAAAADMAELLRSPGAPAWHDVCFTAAMRRTHHEDRLALSAGDPAAAAAALAAFLAGERPARLHAGRAQPDRPAVFVFSGHGCQWPGMGRDLLDGEPAFRSAVEAVDRRFRKEAGWSVLAALRSGDFDVRRTDVAQPALFALQVGLVETLRAYGITPWAVVGHSIGEVAAAYAAGALSLAQATRVVAARTHVQSFAAGEGGMAAAGLGADEARAVLAPYDGLLAVAAENSPQSVTLAGDTAALDRLGAELAARGVFFRRLEADYPFHSPAMERLRAPLLDHLRGLRPSVARTRLLSTVTGGELRGDELDAGYWCDNLCRPVRFAAALQRLGSEAEPVFIEVGAHPVLAHYLWQTLEGEDARRRVLPTLRRAEPGRAGLLAAVGGCHAWGVAPALGALFPAGGRHVRLPRYPWAPERHWYPAGTDDTTAGGRRPPPVSAGHPLLGSRLPGPGGSWEGRLDPRGLSWLAGHRVGGQTLLPAAALLEAAAAAAAALGGDGPCQVEDLRIRRPLVLPGEAPCATHVSVADDGRLSFSAEGPAGWTLHATARVSRGGPAPRAAAPEETLRRCPRRITPAEHYRLAAVRGLHYGPALRLLEAVAVGDGEAVGLLRPPAEPDAGAGTPGGGVRTPGENGYLLHPAVLDAALQPALALAPSEDVAYLPVAVRLARFYDRSAAARYSHVRRVGLGTAGMEVSCRLWTATGETVAELEGIRLRAAPTQQREADRTRVYRAVWEPRALGPAAPEELPGPAPLAAAVAERLPALVRERRRADYYRRLRPELDALAGAYARRALETLAGAGPVSAQALVASGRVSPAHAALLDRLVEMLAEDGAPTGAGGERNGGGAAARQDPDAAWRRLVREWPAYHAELALLGRCGRRLAAVLSGETDPLGLLFPDGPAASLEHLYESAPTQRIYGLMARAAVAEWVRRRPPDRPLRILELGGGTGGLTSLLLPVFPQERTDYLFTDVSEAFVGRAQARFAGFPFVRCRRLDVASSGQTAAAGAFDAVVAANVLHAAGELPAVLDNVRRLLHPGGLLLLVENHRERWTDLVFGLLPGWWGRRDAAPGGASGPLDGDEWTSLLTSAGWEQATALADVRTARPQQSVILARRPAGASQPPAAPRPTRPGAPQPDCLVLAGADPWGRALRDALRDRLSRSGWPAATGALGGDEPDALCAAPAAGGSADGTAAVGPGADPAPGVRAAGRGGPATEPRPREIVCICDGAEWPAADPLPALEALCVRVARLARRPADGPQAVPARLWLVTRGAHAVGEHPGNPVSGAAWGVGRVLANERPELDCRLVDLDPGWDAETAARRLAAEVCAPASGDGPESEVSLAAGGRRVGRIRPLPGGAPGPAPSEPPAALPPRRLVQERVGSMDGLRLRPMDRRAPARGEVEIRVRAAGLNFRDVMWALGSLPPEAVEGGMAGAHLGMECCGEVAAVGPGVSGLAAGDRVVALACQAFADFVTVRAGAVLRLPPQIGCEAGATLPVAHLTAWYALRHLGRLRRGERLLVHGAAGGVGLAAVELAQARGAEVLATAGNVEKRDYLRSLGASAVFDSRSLAFADEVLQATGGRGVDVVLNSLSGEAMLRSLRLLRPFGRFLEIGKRDIYEDRQVGLHALRGNISYFAVDVDRLLVEQPALAGRLVRRLEAAFARGELHPLPHRVFPLSRAVEAFRHMQQSRHTGKIVLTTGEAAVPAAPSAPGEPPPPRPQAWRARPDATYLVTGGLGGFGLATARWLAQQGARHLLLVGRRGAATPEAERAIAALRSDGVRAVAAAVDVADAARLDELLRRLPADLPPLRGVFHAAMVLEDRSLATLDGPSARRVLAPKAAGACNLHRLTLGEPIEQFVCFSSAAALVGNPGQAAYCAANAFVEGLVSWRRSQGLPGLAVAWGPIADAGYAARHPAVLQRFAERVGFRATTAARALDALGRLMAEDAGEAAVVDVDGARLGGLPAVHSPRFDALRAAGGAAASPMGTDPQPPAGGAVAPLDPAARRASVLERLASHLARIAGAARAQLRTDVPITALGVDSLMSMELQEAIWRDFAVEVPAARMLMGDSLADLAACVVRDAGIGGAERPDGQATAAPAADGETRGL